MPITAIKESSEAVTRRKDKEDRDFIKVYRSSIYATNELVEKNPTAYRVFLFLLRQMDSQNALVCPQHLIADHLKRTRQTVSKAIKYLADNGWICILKAGSQKVYVVNPNIAWTSYADDKKYCRFTASVVISSADQPDQWDVSFTHKSHFRHIDKRGFLATTEDIEHETDK